jgi:hypothetical protein
LSTKMIWVNGWEVQRRGDALFGVYNDGSLVAGPFRTEAAGMRAALMLPKRPFAGRSIRPSHEPAYNPAVESMWRSEGQPPQTTGSGWRSADGRGG